MKLIQLTASFTGLKKMISDICKILCMEHLVFDGLITHEEAKRLIYDKLKMEIINDADFPVDICENGDVFIHNRGAYPFVLKEYAKSWIH